MPDWRSMKEHKYIGAWNLVDKEGNPKDFTVEIINARSELVKSRDKPDGEMCPVAYFAGQKKGMVLNATNARMIESFAKSPRTEKWTGLRITIYPTTTKVGREVKDCIRIRPKQPTGTSIEPMDENAGQPPQTETDRGDDPNAY